MPSDSDVNPNLKRSSPCREGPAVGSDDALLARAAELEVSGDVVAAAEIIDRLLKNGPATPRLALLLARVAGEPHIEHEALELISQLLNSTQPVSSPAVASLHFAACSLLDRLGQYDEAFAHASAANRLRPLSYHPQGMERLVDTCMACYSSSTLHGWARASLRDELPVFIVGMPRSGSTLVEQILASHSQIHGAGEIQQVSGLWQTLFHRLGGSVSSLPDALERMTIRDANALASGYLEGLRRHHPDAVRICDKTLSNFMHLGLVWSLFPDARVIYCRRNPLDTCVSCFMTDFSDPLPFTSSLDALGHFHRQLNRLMDHWVHTLNLNLLEVDYESLTADPEAQSRQLVSFAGVAWEEEVMNFHLNRRKVTTASYAQVRRPIYRSSVGRAGNYEKWLKPLRDSLQGLKGDR